MQMMQKKDMANNGIIQLSWFSLISVNYEITSFQLQAARVARYTGTKIVSRY